MLNRIPGRVRVLIATAVATLALVACSSGIVPAASDPANSFAITASVKQLVHAGDADRPAKGASIRLEKVQVITTSGAAKGWFETGKDGLSVHNNFDFYDHGDKLTHRLTVGTVLDRNCHRQAMTTLHKGDRVYV